MKATKYKKKPVTIEAMRVSTVVEAHDASCWMEENLYPPLIGDATKPSTLKYPDQVAGDNSMPDKGHYIDPETGDMVIRTLEGDMHLRTGDYIIKGVQGEFYPCKPDVFEQTYEVAE